MEKKTLNPYLKYSGIGIQMAATIILFALIGRQLDMYINTQKPYLTLLFTLSGTIISIISFIRQLKKI
jgi:F0F1-type ATP synthase assembly protein I